MAITSDHDQDQESRTPSSFLIRHNYDLLKISGLPFQFYDPNAVINAADFLLMSGKVDIKDEKKFIEKMYLDSQEFNDFINSILAEEEYEEYDENKDEVVIKYKEWKNNLSYLPVAGCLSGALVGTTIGSVNAYWKLLLHKAVPFASAPFLGGNFQSFPKSLLHTAAVATTTIPTKQVLNSGFQTGMRFGVFLGLAGYVYPAFELVVDRLRGFLLREEEWWPGQREDNLNTAVAGFGTGVFCKALSGPRASLFNGASFKAMSGPRATAFVGAFGAVAALVGKPLIRKLRGVSTDHV